MYLEMGEQCPDHHAPSAANQPYSSSTDKMSAETVTPHIQR